MTRKKKMFLGVVALVLLAIGLGALIIRKGFSAREKPSVMEAMVARTVRVLSVPNVIKSMKNSQPSTAQNIREGMEHFADHCSICHANNGSGDTEFGRNMYPKPPDLRMQETQAMSDGVIGRSITLAACLSVAPIVRPRFSPPPAMTIENACGQWSRPAIALIRGVRPNSVVSTTSVESSWPR